MAMVFKKTTDSKVKTINSKYANIGDIFNKVNKNESNTSIMKEIGQIGVYVGALFILASVVVGGYFGFQYLLSGCAGGLVVILSSIPFICIGNIENNVNCIKDDFNSLRIQISHLIDNQRKMLELNMHSDQYMCDRLADIVDGLNKIV